MSRFNRFIKSLTSPISGSSGERSPFDTAGDQRRKAEFRRRRDRAGGGDVVEKQSVDRRATDFGTLENALADEGAKPKPYDPVFLSDIARNAFVQAYIDTLAQDAASASWKLRPRAKTATSTKGTSPTANAWSGIYTPSYPLPTSLNKRHARRYDSATGHGRNTITKTATN